MRFLSVSLLLTGSGITVHAAPGIGVYPFLQTYVRPPMRQARLAKQGRRTIFLLTGEYSPSPACLHLTGLTFRKQKNIRIPGAGRPETKGKKSFEDMEDALTLVLIIVLCLVFKPLIAAILRGLGSSEHRRDR